MKGKTTRVPIGELVLRPIRRDHGSDEDLVLLAESWLARPVHPVICRPDMVVADGTRRVMGLKLRGVTEVEVLVTEDDLSDADLLEIGVATATHREGLSPFEQVEAIRRYGELMPSATGKAMAERLRIHETKLSVLRTIGACPRAFAALADGRVSSIKGAYQVACAAPEHKDGVINLLAGGGTVDQASAARKPRPDEPASDDKGGRPKRTSIPVPKLKACVSVTAEVASVDGLIAVLTEALELARKSLRENHSLATATRAWADKARAGA